MRRPPKYGIPVAIGAVACVSVLIWDSAANAIVGLSTILLTSILVSVTWYYADETRTMRQETQTSRLFSLPLLRLTGTLTTEPKILVRNIGQGFARDVELIIIETDGDSDPVAQPLRIPVLGPGEGVEFSPRAHVIRSASGFELFDASIAFEARGTYFDAAGTKHHLNDTFSLSEFISGCESLGVEFESVRDFSKWRESLEEGRYRQSVLSGFKSIADAISRFRR